MQTVRSYENWSFIPMAACLSIDPFGFRNISGHNVLRNTAKGVVEGFPLKIEAQQIEVRDTEPDLPFMRHLLPTLSFPCLRSAAKDLGLDVAAFPESLTEALAQDEEFLKALHKTLFDVHVLEGALICPETGRRFSIVGGVVDMMMKDEEVV